ncbi:hypothetical protein ABW20_dc0109811 [Dactylellina cionopaga]|nr:hypothetical protein ABW20_dc0109811 [Dactylellina cionopaga]
MRLFAPALLALLSVVSSSPLAVDHADASASTKAYPGDAFLRVIASNSPQKFAINIPLAATSSTTRHHLAIFRAATLSLNVTNPTDHLLDVSREFRYPVFDHKCKLGKDANDVIPFAASTTLGPYFENLFRMIPTWTKGEILLSRFDLFHAHLFANPTTKTAGVVFHSKEYPADNANTFPYNLGFCQVDSNLTFVDKVMRKRNIVWTIDSSDRTSLRWVDMGVKSGNNAVDAILGGEPFYTLYEENLGHVVADFYYLDGLELGISLY